MLRIEGVLGKLDRKIYLRVIGLALLTTALVLFLYRVDLPWLAVLIRVAHIFVVLSYRRISAKRLHQGA